MDLLQKTKYSDSDFFSEVTKSINLPDKKQTAAPVKTVESCAYRFDSLHNLIRLSHAVSNFILCPNSLYKDKTTADYRLVIYNRQIEVNDFNRLCNAVSEYGDLLRKNSSGESFYKEHFDLVIGEHALQSLVEI